MKTKWSFSLLFALVLGLSSCADRLIGDAEERETVRQDFAARKTALNNEALFQVFEQDLSSREREALTFLYAYMPLGDMADHDGNYFVENVNIAFKAKKEMPWGKDIPEREFRHFVLPVRVNNEDLDDSRKLFYEELKDRVKGLSLYDAVLEVNHWCHEKVVYTPSDSRTSSPLASVRTAYGRCGEESTFTVAALRAVCIPARQVYTPRWAHTDDNHAWVEAWVNGKWYFFGACEPEPMLDLGWFNAPASRGMLMHTKAFGRYKGPEEVMKMTPTYTEINVIDNYAPTAKAEVSVVDTKGRPVADATVEFKLYNYAEFYSVAKKQTDKDGKTFLTAGKGDMLVWASKNGAFGYSKFSFGKDRRITVALDRQVGKIEPATVEFDMIPPPEKPNVPEVTEAQRAENNVRLNKEDSIRNAYVATFLTEADAREFARKNGLDEDAVSRILVASRGNHGVLCNFMSRLHAADSKRGGVNLLQQISSKDLRDVKLDVLIDHMMSHYRIKNADYYRRYVRNPRISNELLTPYQLYFDKHVPADDQKAFQEDPMKLVEWVTEHIRIDSGCNLGGAPISPVGVWKTRVADEHSRDIFFVALSRAMGIPARIDQVTGKVQWIEDDAVLDITFGQQAQVQQPKGWLSADYRPVSYLKNPKYYNHFTISKLTDKGTLRLLSYDEGDSGMEEGTGYDSLLRKGTPLDVGDYVLVTGTRLANGGVLTHLTFFTVRPSEKTTVDLVMRDAQDEVKVIGNFDSESLYRTPDQSTKSVLSTTGRGYFIVGILGVGQEPTNHAMKDIAALSAEFEKWGRKLVLLFPNEEQYRRFDASDFEGLPATIAYGIDADGAIRKQIVDGMKLSDANSLPIFIIADTFNRVVFVSQGYTIGLGEQLMNIIHQL